MRWPERWPCVFLLAAVASTSVFAQDQFWLAAGDSDLEQLRGGFAIGPGLMVSFGISRTVELNGAVVSSTSFHIDDLATVTAAQGQQLALAMAGTLVQSGSGNALTVDAQNALSALVVQNALNNQKIRTTTQIDAVSNGMSLLKNLNLSRTLTDAFAAGVRR